MSPGALPPPLPDHLALWRREFPTFLPEWMPEVPPSWEDRSWHNDAMPFFTAGRFTGVFVDAPYESGWSDFSDVPRERWSRYQVCRMDWDEEYGPQHPVDNFSCLLATDDWNEVLAFVARRIEEMG